ncbi:DUF2163 domain-containing protein [Sphingomonas sp. BK235]|uniref:DUF2163 domain-containing protein n=1 Tax=Sphingomonas sp. BK235 TaxID=2512131 RepID=UPI00104EF4DF|nr:DUF2163 domain-containing protein [Sphingomonas sp. BK235]TCP33612.1 putative phage protein (TIGR02218 family) [Sphingomonas sp. BK235]
MSDRVIALALCWRLERRDGVTLALTSHDRDLVVVPPEGDLADALVYRAAPGLTPSAVTLGEGLDADTMEASGALTAAAIAARDLADGRWDGARLVCLAVDWSDPAAPARLLGSGRIGAVSVREHDFTAEWLGEQARLDRPAVETTSPTCRAALGDARCRVMMAGRRRYARVVASAGEVVTLDMAEPESGAYGGGTLRWCDGAAAGSRVALLASAGATVTLAEPPPHPVAAGTLVELVEGCDKRLATCARRFGNAVNFRGEPFVPGTDLLTRYPAG